MAERTYLYGYGTGPYGAGTTRKTKAWILAQPPWAEVHPELMRRLFGLADWVIDHGSDYGFGSGRRSTVEQYNLFHSRYDKVPAGALYDVYWDGKPFWPTQAGFYKRVFGATVAPPGRSYHEPTTNNGLGYALGVDMVGNHAIGNPQSFNFGLKNFSQVNNEPWHYQGFEYPNARANYRGEFERPRRWPLPNDPTMGVTDMTPERPERTYDSRETGGAFGVGEIRRIPIVFGEQAQIAGGVWNTPGQPGWWAYSPDGDFSRPNSIVNAYGDDRWYNFGGIDVLAPGGHIFVKSQAGGHIYVDRYARIVPVV